MKRLLLTLAVYAALIRVAGAQAGGIPASAVSLRPGHLISPGIPASVTSLRPLGFGTSLVPIHGTRLNRRFDRRFRLSHSVPFFNTLPIVQVVTVPDQTELEGQHREPQPQKLEVTIVDNRQPAKPAEQPGTTPPLATPAPEPPPLPATMLVLRDGTRRELKNFAIMAGVIYDLANEKMFGIDLAVVDRDATNRANAAAGRAFQLP